MARDDKWLSPYDPRSGKFGKIKKPKTATETSQHSLRGCGDPRCAQCNPEMAAIGAAGGNGMPTERFVYGGGGGSSSSRPNMQFIWDEMRRMTSGEWVASDEVLRPSLAQREPESYTNARKAVEKWLVTAPDQKFSDIIGNDDALSQLRDAIRAPVEHKELYEAYGMKMPKGALLSGPPGCGKTMFARAAASEMKALYGANVEFVSISGSELQSPYVGVTEGYIKSIFTFAREYQKLRGHPLLVFMDEAEVLLPDRTGRVRRVAPWEESQVATFLAEMDGILESGAFVLLATNRPEVIDQAVLRDGRCDFKIVVKRPTIEAVEIIVRNSFTGKLVGDDGLEALVFAAVESLRDPHKIIMEAHAIEFNGETGRTIDLEGRSFTLENIVSGAMAASIAMRATRYAFARDKAAGTANGISTADVVRSVNDLFEENRGLEHAFALDEFKREFTKDIRREAQKRMN